MSTDTYFAQLPPEDLAKNRLQKIEAVRKSRRSTDLARRLHRNWLMYYGLNDWKASLSDNLYASGPNGERVELRVNHARNILMHMHQLTTSTRPDLTPKAATMDIKSLKQCNIAKGIIDHYLEFENVWHYIDVAVEHALVLHGGFIHAPWDPDKGEPWSAEPGLEGNPGKIIYQGDFCFRNPSLFDVVFDQMVASWDEIHDVTIREWVLKWDLIAKKPELETKILRQKTKREWEVYDAIPQIFFTQDESEQIEVHTFYHDRTPACPEGRQTRFLSDGTVLEDGPLMYNRIPLFRVAANEVLGTPHAWSPLTDLASLQESINKGYSTAATNQFAFGVQNIWAPRGSRLDVTQLTGGLNLIEGSPVGPNGGKPEVLQLLNTPKEVFEFIEMEVKTMETLSGVNQVVRGNPEAGLTAGVALALVSTQSLQFLSPLQRSYGECARDLMKFIIDTLKVRATAPRILHMVGQTKREALVHFTGGDIEGVNRVAYEMGNPMTRTPAGRMQLAQSIVEAGVPLMPEQILEVIDKGRLDPQIQPTIDELDNIFLENEDLRNGVQVPVLAGDRDPVHLREHIAELQNPDLRRNIGAQQAMMMHINEHVKKHMGGDIIRGIIDGLIPPPFAMMMGAQPPGGPGQEGKPGQPGQHQQQNGRQPPPAKGSSHPPQPNVPAAPPLPTM